MFAFSGNLNNALYVYLAYQTPFANLNYTTMKKIVLALLMMLSLSTFLPAQADSETTTLDSAELEAIYLERMAFIQDSIESTMNYETGEIILGDGIATLNVPAGYKYLNPTQSEYVMTELWGNPPSETMGLLLPAHTGVFDYETYVIEINFEAMGYVDDEDAEDIDYDELLETMQSDVQENNEARAAAGYATVDLVGWASPPYYDAAEKKLHWAKELRFEGEDWNTLNYNIRVLGRKGVMVLNFISEMSQLEQVETDLPSILPSVNFNEGYQYKDFDPNIDEIAAVGIGGLIAGKVLAKAGFFGILAKFGKFIIVGLVALFGGIRKFMSGRRA